MLMLLKCQRLRKGHLLLIFVKCCHSCCRNEITPPTPSSPISIYSRRHTLRGAVASAPKGMPPPNPDRVCASAVRAARTAEPAARPSGRGRRTASTSGPGDAEATRRLALLASPVAPLVGCGPEGTVPEDQPQHAGGAQEGSEEEEASIQQQVGEEASRQLHPTEVPADEKEVPAGAASGGGGGGGLAQHHSESSEAMLGALQRHGDGSVASVQQRQRGPSSLDQQVRAVCWGRWKALPPLIGTWMHP